METADINGASGSQLEGIPNPAGKLPRRSGKNSQPEKGRDGMPHREPKLTTLEAALSLLQSAYEQALDDGLFTHLSQRTTTDGAPVLAIQLLNITVCPTCQAWNLGPTCPTCPNK